MKFRTFFLVLACLLLAIPAVMAQSVPQGFTYQAVARNNTKLLENRTLSVRFTLENGGSPQYQEIQSVTTNQYGVFSCVVGQGQQILGNFSTLDWGTGAWFLKVEVDDPNIGWVALGTNRLQSIPFALYSERAATIDSLNLGDLTDVIAPVPDTGDVLKFDGTQWVSAPDQGGTVIPGTGLALVNDTLYNIGDIDSLNDITIGTLAGGDLAGTYPDPLVAQLQGKPVSASAPGVDDVLKWNGTEWEPRPDAVATGSGLAVNTSARISGTGQPGDELDIAQQNASPGQVLKWNGASWTPANDNQGFQTLSINGTLLTIGPNGNSVNLPVASFQPGTGIDIQGSLIINTGDTDPTNDITNTTSAGGDLSGTYPNPLVTGIWNNGISPAPPTAGQILKFNNGQWEPAADQVNDADADPNNEIQTLSQPTPTTIVLSNNGGSATIPTYTAGQGIQISGFSISNTGDLNGGDDVLIGSAAGGDLTGAYPNPTIGSLQSTPLSNGAPAPGQVLRFSNGQWAPGTNDDADADPQNEIQQLTLNGSTLGLTGTSNTVTLPSPPVYTGGPGITVSGTTIINTGDLNPDDDVLDTDLAGGDVTGVFSNLSVVRIQGNAVANTNPTPGQILKWTGTQWAPSNDLVNDGDVSTTNELQSLTSNGNQLSLSNGGGTVTMYQAGIGISVNGNTIANTGDLNPNDDINIGDNAGGDLDGTYPDPTVIRLQGNPVSATTPTPGQILKWTGSSWVPSNDLTQDGDFNPINELQTLSLSGGQLSLSNGGGTVNIPTYSAGQGINISVGGEITNTGDLNPNNDIVIGTAAGNDLAGTYPNPTVARIQNQPVSSTTPTQNQVLKFINGQWVPGTDASEDDDSDPQNELQTVSANGNQFTLSNGGGTVTMYQAGTGISVVGNQINNIGDVNPNDDLTDVSQAGGDVSGTFDDLTVEKIQGRDVSAALPTNGQVLKYNTLTQQWEPQVDGNTTYTPGVGISFTGTTINNTGDLNPADDLLIGAAAGGDLGGAYPDPDVTGIQGNPVATTNPGANQVLKFIGGQWQPAADAVNDADSSPTNELQTVSANGNQFTLSNGGGTVTMYQAGAGIQVTGNVISNSGDLDGSDDVNNGDAASGDLGGTYPGPVVTGIQNQPVSSQNPNPNQVLKFIGGQWIPATDAVNDADASPTNELQTLSSTGNQLTLSNGGGTITMYQAGAGISVTGNTITNTGDPDGSDDLLNTDVAAGDVTGTFSNLTVTGLQGEDISTTAPTVTGQVLKWDNITQQWEPGSDQFEDADSDPVNEFQTISQTGNQLSLSDGGGTVTLFQAGTGIGITGNTITNLGDPDGSDDLLDTDLAGGDVSGTFSNLEVTGIRGQTVTNTPPTTTGQILKWDNAAQQWVLATDAVDDADASPTNELQTVTASGNQFTLSDGGGTVTMYQAGTGIGVSGNTISNTGDTNAADDLTNATNFTGDVSGTGANLTVTGLQGIGVAAATPTNGQVLKWNSTSGDWEPAADEGTTYTGGTGIAVSGTVISNTGDLSATNELQTVTASGNQFTLSDGGGTVTMYQAGTGIGVSGNTISNTGDTNAADDLTNVTNFTGDVSGTGANLTVTGLQGVGVSTTAPTTNGQVLKWNSTSGEWEPGSDDGTTFTAGTGISISGTTIANTGDLDNTNELQTVSATGNQFTLSNGGGTVTMYQAGTGILVSGNTIINAGDTDGTDDVNVGDAATGDLTGTYPAPTVAAIQGQPVASLTPTAGQVLKYQAGQWVPATDAVDDADASATNELQTISQTGNQLSLSDGGGTVTLFQAGAGIGVTGNTISNTGDTNAADDLTNATNFTGDVSGTGSTLTVTGLQGTGVSATAPTTNGQVLKWNSTSGEWEPGSDDGANYVGGAGITVTGTTITNDGDLDGSDDVLVTDNAGGDVSGTFANLTVTALQGTDVSANVPTTNGQVLKWNSGTGAWEPGTDQVGDADADATNELQTISQTGNQLTLSDGGGTVTLFTAGTGISVTSNVISATGDPDAADDVNIGDNAGGDLDGTYPNPTVAGLQGQPVANLIPANGQVLKYNAGQWAASGDLVDDADADATNELQTLSQSGLDLTLSDGGGTVTVVQAGAGLSVSGNTLTNTGDLDGSDDVLLNTAASGDVTGDFTAGLNVVGLQGNTVSATAPTFTGQVLKWNASTSEWEPGIDNGIAYTAGPGISITGTTISNSGDLNAFDDLTTSTAFGGDVSGAFNSLSVVALQGQSVSSSAPTSDGQVLVWNSGAGQWEPGDNADGDADATNELQTLSQTGNQLTLSDGGGTVTLFQAGTGISISGNTIINSGDPNAADDITTSTTAGGDVSGNFGGLTVQAIQGNAVAASTPTVTGQVLKWDAVNSQWDLGTDNNTTYTAGPGITINGSNQISNAGDLNGTDDVLLTTAATGDVTGDFTAGLNVVALQGSDVSATAPTSTGQVLKWNNVAAEWEPGTDENTTYNAGAGITIDGSNNIINDGDTDGTDDVLLTTAATGDVSGDFTAGLTVTALQGSAVSTTAPTTTGQVLKWNAVASEWEPGTDENTEYTAGTGLTLTGTTLDVDNTVVTADPTGGVTGQVARYDGTQYVLDSLSGADISITADFEPNSDNLVSLGSATKRWTQLFAANATINTSDVRMKEQITDLDYGLAEVMALRPVSYQWINRPEDGRKLGLIAQEVLEVVEEAVYVPEDADEPGSTSLFGLTYTELIPVLIRGMQEQQSLIEAQKAQLQEQAELLQQFEARLRQLEQE